MPKRTIIINGNNFSNLEGFYTEIDNILTQGLDWKTGHNLDALMIYYVVDLAFTNMMSQ